MRIVRIGMLFMIGISWSSAMAGESRVEGLRIVARFGGSGSEFWFPFSVGGRWYFLGGSNEQLRPQDKIVEKFDAPRDQVSSEHADAAYSIIRKAPDTGNDEFLTADVTVDPPVVFWSRKRSALSKWAIEPAKDEREYYVKNLGMKNKMVWLTIGDSTTPRTVFQDGNKRLNELRPATLGEQRRDAFYIALRHQEEIGPRPNRR